MPKPPRLRPLYAFGDATGNRTPVAGETVRHNYRYTMAPFIIKEEPTLYISIKLPIHIHPKELQKYRAGFEPASLFLNLYVYIISEISIKIKLFLSKFSFSFAFYTLEKAVVSRVSLLNHITTKRTSTFLIPWRHNCDSNADYQKVGHLSRVLR